MKLEGKDALTVQKTIGMSWKTKYNDIFKKSILFKQNSLSFEKSRYWEGFGNGLATFGGTAERKASLRSQIL